MKRAHIISRFCVVGLLSTGLFAAGCGGSEEPETSAVEAGDDRAGTLASAGSPEGGQELTVTGCLTASIDGRSYALSPADSTHTPAAGALATPGSTTITYELVGNAEDFRRHANTMVTARGRADALPGVGTEMERESTAQQQGMAGSNATPTVETKEEVDVNVRRLHVASVVATGDTCPSLDGGVGRATGAPDAAGSAGATAPQPKSR